MAPEDIIEFGLHWMKLTTTAVYDENEREILDPEIDVGDTGPDLKQFFACIYTFLNGDM